jgi:hypothetical protein
MKCSAACSQRSDTKRARKPAVYFISAFLSAVAGSGALGEVGDRPQEAGKFQRENKFRRVVGVYRRGIRKAKISE